VVHLDPNDENPRYEQQRIDISALDLMGEAEEEPLCEGGEGEEYMEILASIEDEEDEGDGPDPPMIDEDYVDDGEEEEESDEEEDAEESDEEEDVEELLVEAKRIMSMDIDLSSSDDDDECESG
jgi:hypothetical protein